MKSILVTGATGFLGSNLVRELLLQGFNIVVLKRSFSDTSRLSDVFQKCKSYDADFCDLEDIFKYNNIEVILHCATDYGRSSKTSDVIQANLTLPLKLLELADKHETKYFINTDTILDKRISEYSLSKAHFLDWLEFYSRKNIKCVNVAIEHFYGAYDNKTKFVSKIIYELLRGVESIDLTLGEQKRDFIFIDDVVNAFVMIIKSLGQMTDNDIHFFEVGTNINTSIKDLILILTELTNNTKTKLNFGSLPYRRNEVMNSNVSSDSLRKLGWIPKISLLDGLQKTVSLEQSDFYRSDTL
jgi:CDP-paratose synthetase